MERRPEREHPAWGTTRHRGSDSRSPTAARGHAASGGPRHPSPHQRNGCVRAHSLMLARASKFTQARTSIPGRERQRRKPATPANRMPPASVLIGVTGQQPVPISVRNVARKSSSEAFCAISSRDPPAQQFRAHQPTPSEVYRARSTVVVRSVGGVDQVDPLLGTWRARTRAGAVRARLLRQ